MAKKQSVEINDLIFKELIKRGYSVEGKTRIWNIADSKLWYLTPKQAEAYLELTNSEEYAKKFLPKEINLIKENMDKIIKKTEFENVNLIDLGCGDGKKAQLFINRIKETNKVRYCPIDISDYMVEEALSRIRETDVDEVVKFQWNISDFENIENVSNLLRFGDFKKNFTLLLGNTLSNFEINELLYKVRRSMKGEDYVLIGNGIYNKNINKDINDFSKNKKFNEFLYKVPELIGIKRNEVDIGVQFKNSRVEHFFTLLKDKTIKFQNKEIKFNKGDEVIVVTSYRYPKKEFLSFLNLYFDSVEAYFSKDESYVLALCKK